MATDTAIATVTLALRQTIQSAINAAAELSADVVSENPDKLSNTGDAVINVYMLQGQMNPYLRNNDLEPQLSAHTEDGKRKVTRRWVTPLVLNYLISFYGDERALVPQRLMAVTVAALHRNPVVTPERLARIARSAFPDAPALPVSDFEDVEIEMSPQSVQDVHRIWTALRAPYALSTLYEARTALIQSDPDSQDLPVVEALDIRAVNKRRPPDVDIDGPEGQSSK